MRIHRNAYLLILIAILLTANACEKEEKIEPDVDEPKPEQQIPEGVIQVNRFIDENMNEAYFWSTDIPKIDYSKEADPEEYFYKLLKEPNDKWSFITDDIDALMAHFQGVKRSNGLSAKPYYVSEGSSQVIFIVEYVYRNSPASEAGLKRGDIILKINGQEINDSNYRTLINADIIEVTLGDRNEEGDFIAQPQVIELIAVEALEHHPVIANSIIEDNEVKIGYLAYSSFTSNYDTSLVNIFTGFNAAGVTNLVLDLRYNSGGSMNSALLLANLIAPASAVGQVFIREKWNDKLEEMDKEILFEEQIGNLNLSTVYILSTERTASASEMVMYGLAPYMDVIQVGTKTYGKYYGSVMIQDIDPATNQRRHSWAIQPIVVRAENTDNSLNYLEGLPPNFELTDNYYNAQLGDEQEYFLANAISIITTGQLKLEQKTIAEGMPVKAVDGYIKAMDPLHGLMIKE